MGRLRLGKDARVFFDRVVCRLTRFCSPSSMVVEALLPCLAHRLLCGEAPFEELVLGCPREGARDNARIIFFAVHQLAFILVEA